MAKVPKSLEEELTRDFEGCWDVHYTPDGGESYFSVHEAIVDSAKIIREIAKEYNEWYSKRLESWMDYPLDFPEVEGDEDELFDIYLKERYGRKKT